VAVYSQAPAIKSGTQLALIQTQARVLLVNFRLSLNGFVE